MLPRLQKKGLFLTLNSIHSTPKLVIHPSTPNPPHSSARSPASSPLAARGSSFRRSPAPLRSRSPPSSPSPPHHPSSRLSFHPCHTFHLRFHLPLPLRLAECRSRRLPVVGRRERVELVPGRTQEPRTALLRGLYGLRGPCVLGPARPREKRRGGGGAAGGLTRGGRSGWASATAGVARALARGRRDGGRGWLGLDGTRESAGGRNRGGNSLLS